MSVTAILSGHWLDSPASDLNIEGWYGSEGSLFESDITTGKRYVDSAYGGDGIWSRWCTYAATKHGGNVELRKLVERSIAGILPQVIPICAIGASAKLDSGRRDTRTRRFLEARSPYARCDRSKPELTPLRSRAAVRARTHTDPGAPSPNWANTLDMLLRLIAVSCDPSSVDGRTARRDPWGDRMRDPPI
jgi:hypothetical protein